MFNRKLKSQLQTLEFENMMLRSENSSLMKKNIELNMRAQDDEAYNILRDKYIELSNEKSELIDQIEFLKTSVKTFIRLMFGR